MQTQHESSPSEKISVKPTSESVHKLLESDPKEDVLGLASSNASDKPSTQAADLLGIVAYSADAQLTTRVTETSKGFSKVSEGKDMAIDGSMELPTLELSLKRLRSTRVGGAATHGDCNVLRRYDLSALSRHNTSVASTQAPTGYGGSCSPLASNSEGVKAESAHNMICNSNAAILNQGSNGSSDNNDMGSTTKNVFTKPAVFKVKTVPALPIKSGHPFAFLRVQLLTPPQVLHEKIDDVKATGKPRAIQHQVQVQHSHHHHLHVHNMQQLQDPPDQDDSTLKNLAADAFHCGSSNVFSGPLETNAANYSLNGSNSGSNHGSNGQNGSSTAVHNGGVSMEIAEGTRGGNGSGSKMDQNRFAQREAALNKFRQKRKERNF